MKPRILVLEIRDKDRQDAEALGWVLVDREETYQRYSPDGEIYKASICLSYQRITVKYSRHSGDKGQFFGSYFRDFNAVSLTSSTMSKGGVFLDLPELEGQRVGTYLMNEIVQWAQQWPDAIVNSVELVAGQAYDGNKARRNWFYEQFGLAFDYTDPEHQAGLSKPIQVSALTTVDKWKQNIVEHRLLDYLADVLLSEELATSELEARSRACKELIAERRRAEKRPLRWALKQLYYRYASTVIAGFVLIMLASLVWVKMRT